MSVTLTPESRVSFNHADITAILKSDVNGGAVLTVAHVVIIDIEESVDEGSLQLHQQSIGAAARARSILSNGITTYN